MMILEIFQGDLDWVVFFLFRFPEAKHAVAFYSDLKPGDINRNREVSGGIYLKKVTLYCT